MLEPRDLTGRQFGHVSLASHQPTHHHIHNSPYAGLRGGLMMTYYLPKDEVANMPFFFFFYFFYSFSPIHSSVPSCTSLWYDLLSMPPQQAAWLSKPLKSMLPTMVRFEAHIPNDMPLTSVCL